MWKKLRITFLFYILVLVLTTTWSSRTRQAEWKESLWVTIYPINGDGSEVSKNHIESLSAANFDSIEDYIVSESDEFNLAAKRPIDVKLSEEIEDLPPMVPAASSGLSVMLWSLKMRWWAWRSDNFSGPTDIQVFVLYFDPATNPRLRHSLGLRKGFIGVVNAFASADYSAQNKVVITHELMHALGASDLYDPETNYPHHPAGFANPFKTPTLPQEKATLMAGRIPITEFESRMPSSLKQTIISKQTAVEIGWQK